MRRNKAMIEDGTPRLWIVEVSTRCTYQRVVLAKTRDEAECVAVEGASAEQNDVDIEWRATTYAQPDKKSDLRDGYLDALPDCDYKTENKRTVREILEATQPQVKDRQS